MIFEENLFSIYALLTNQKTIAWLSLMLEIWGNVCFVINFSGKSVTSEILKLTLAFISSRLFPNMTKKSEQQF